MPATTTSARYREVLRILVRHGFGFVVGGRGIFGRLRSTSTVPIRPAELRLAIEELGVAFIKFGQVLSTRADLIPDVYAAELAKLQDAVPPAPSAEIIAVIERELKHPIAEIFTVFDPVPLASASIGQVHAVTLPGGVDAVVKVQRPGVRDQVTLDLEIGMRLARLVERRFNFRERTGIDLPAIVEEYSFTLRSELDYLREAKNTEIFQHNFADSPGIYIPAICWEYTTGYLITMERLHGMRIDNVPALIAAGYDPPAIAIESAKLVLREVFEYGLFHADLHPGNMFVMDGGIVGVIDFGMVGTLDDTTRTQLLLLVVAVISQDAERITDYLFRLGVVPGSTTNRAALRRDVKRVVAQYYGLQLNEIDTNVLLTDMLKLVQRHHLQMPSELALMLKMLAMAEGLARTLDPNFNMLAVAQPFGAEAIGLLFSPKRMLESARRFGIDVLEIGADLPLRLDRVLRQSEQSAQQLHEEVEAIQHSIQVMVNRLTIGLLIAAFVVGFSIIVRTLDPSGASGWFRVFVGVGVLLVTVLSGYYLWMLWRGQRNRNDV